MIKTILITNDPIVAAEAEAAGAARIMVDLETMGKKERQQTRNTFISIHQKDDIAKIRKALKTSELIVRINPWHDSSPAEIDHAIAHGADFVMLPMITSLDQLDKFLATLKGRAKPLPLVETSYSMEHVGDIAAREVDELYIGLNDLHLSLGLDFLFEPLSMGLIDDMAEKIKAAGKSFGFGGIAAIGGEGELPAECILAEHVRLGSTRVILSSRFGRDIRISEPEGRAARLKKALADLRQAYYDLVQRSPQQQLADRDMTFAMIRGLALKMGKQRKRKP